MPVAIHTDPGYRTRPVSTDDFGVTPYDRAMRENRDRAAVVLSDIKRSVDWMKNDLYPWWEEVYQNYLMEGTREAYEDEPEGGDSRILGLDGRPIPGKSPDPRRIRINTPDTYSTVTRRVARATAQLPVLRYRSTDQEHADRVGRTLMHQWDMHVQHCQERHVLQADLFGISIRAWSYRNDRVNRTKRFRWEKIAQNQLGPEDGAAFQQQYGEVIAQMAAAGMDPANALQQIGAQFGGRIPISGSFTQYIGPRADFLFIGDCFLYPRFQSLQESPWFICIRKRNRAWFKKLMAVVQQENRDGRGLEYANRVAGLIDKMPYGSEEYYSNVDGDIDTLRERLAELVNESASKLGETNLDPAAAEWTVTEIHYTGDDAHVEYQLGTEWLCSLRLFELDGKIPFTELRSGANLLHGVGDPPAKLIRNLQAAHSRRVEQKLYVGDALVRPKYWTNSRRLLNEPGLLKRYQGMDVIFLNDDEKIDGLDEQAALAALATSSNDEGGMSRLIQQATGESNMSLAADVDPRQAQTATGSKLMARNQDILTRLMLGRVHWSIREDAQMMFALNRSEMDEAYSFDGAPYKGGDGAQGQAPTGPMMMKAEPEDFQSDSIIEPEIGSTLAEDDEAQVAKATNLFAMATQTPQLFNPQTARNRLLRAYGEGGRITEWEPPPPQGPPPAPPMEAGRVSISVSYTELPGEVQQAINRQLIAAATSSGAETVPPDAVPTPEQQAVSDLGGLMQSMAADEIAEGEAEMTGANGSPMISDTAGSPFVS